jgi:predicted phosphoribosyltransferase
MSMSSDTEAAFHDRADAGRRLAQSLAVFGKGPFAILALPRGGVPVAAEIARALAAPLDIVLVRKIGVPHQPEYAMGAIAEGDPPVVIRNESVIRALHIPDRAFDDARQRETVELERRRRAYRGDQAPIDVANRTVILVDDGIATGMTMRAAALAVGKRLASRVVIAAPVIAHDVATDMRREFADVICVEEPDDLYSVGRFYADFSQVGDDEVREILRRHDGRAAIDTTSSAGD